MSIVKYLKLTLCDGCQQCVHRLPNGQHITQEHVIMQEDVTQQMKGFVPKKDVEVVDVEIKPK